MRPLESHGSLGLFIAQSKHFSVNFVALKFHVLFNLKLESAIGLLELLDVGLLAFILLAELLEVYASLALFEHDLLLVELAHLAYRLGNEQADFHLLLAVELLGGFFGRARSELNVGDLAEGLTDAALDSLTLILDFLLSHAARASSLLYNSLQRVNTTVAIVLDGC